MACQGCQERREKLLSMFGFGPKKIANIYAAPLDGDPHPHVHLLLVAYLRASDGHVADIVLRAATHLMALVLSHTCSTRQSAEANLDDFYKNLRTILLSRYDAQNGKRRQVIPVGESYEQG